VEETTGLRDAARALVGPGSGLPIESINAHKTLISGSLP
jgi:hypothetical protein